MSSLHVKQRPQHVHLMTFRRIDPGFSMLRVTWQTCARYTTYHRRVARYASSFKRVLAIESSCDDSAVAVVDYATDEKGWLPLQCRFHEKVTANTDMHRGIHPIIALDSHRTNIPLLVEKAIKATRDETKSCPDFIAVTRGPGMRANLSVGMDTAKGLAIAWGIPLVGVHHMQAHALTPRLLSITANEGSGSWDEGRALQPQFPFLSVLVSGGHSLLLDSTGLLDYKLLGQTNDLAIGRCIDKAARAILPEKLLVAPFGKALETFAFHSEIRNDKIIPSSCRYDYTPPAKRGDEIALTESRWGWTLPVPLRESKGADKSSRRMMLSFSGLLSTLEPLAAKTSIRMLERQDMAREFFRVAFEHLASRIMLHFSNNPDWPGDTIVVSGGVASNGYLRHVLRSILDVRGYGHIKLLFPPPELCTDNALMIAWTGIEMYEAGWRSNLDIHGRSTWSMDSTHDDKGIIGIGGWHKIDTSPQSTTPS